MLFWNVLCSFVTHINELGNNITEQQATIEKILTSIDLT